MNTDWSVSDISKALQLRSSDIGFRDIKGEWHLFTVIATPERIVFGGCCNVGFIESGYLEREEGEGLDDALLETLEDLETYYNDGPRYVSRIVCNERM